MGPQVTDNFYRAFEEKYRGSRPVILQRLAAYLPFLTPLKEVYEQLNAVDLGCGRGEWLEFLQQEGFSAVGVDSDGGMLAASEELGLNAVYGDALGYLASLEDESQVIVSAFHLVEHITFDQLRELVSQSLRVLKPGGLLIMETPNPENITVGTCNFYLDPTHRRPIPPLLLSFLTEHYRYARTKVVRLQESQMVRESVSPTIVDVLAGVSPDYSIVTQKAADLEVLSRFDAVFDLNYGLSLDVLARRYDDARLAESENFKVQLQSVESKTREFYENNKAKIAEIYSYSKEYREDHEIKIVKIHDQLEKYMARVEDLSESLYAIHQSTSWKVTAPLRYVSSGLKVFLRLLFSSIKKIRHSSIFFVKKIIKKAIRRSILFVNQHQWLKQRILGSAKRVPRLRGFLAKLAAEVNWGMEENNHFHSFNQPIGSITPLLLPSFPAPPETIFLPATVASASQWIRMVGHVEGHYSLAIVNRNLAIALEQISQGKLSFVPFHGKEYDELPELPSDQAMSLYSPLRRTVPVECDVLSVVHHYPLIADDRPAKQRGIIFFWEETSVPIEIVDNINLNFDIVWVAASSVKRALINSGCRASVFVIPIGIDHLITADVQPLEHIHVADNQRMRFLHVSSVFERKGVDVLLAAYLEAFTEEDNVELYIKTFPNPHNHVDAQLNAITQGDKAHARVIIDESPLDDAGMVELYRSAHAMVLPTRGEGFNLPAAEAMALGLPVIVTGYGAQVDFCCQATATLINFHFAKSRSHVSADDACWVEPDRSDLVKKLRSLHERILVNDPVLEERRQTGIRYVRETYQWRNGARCLLASANWLKSQGGSDKDPFHVAVLSPWATHCGIAEYSHKLLSAISGAPDVRLSIYCDDRTEIPPANTEVCWTLGNNSSVPKALRHISDGDAQALLVQHQPSLFPLSDECCARLAELSRDGKVVMLELHSTLPLLASSRVSGTMVKNLAALDRIIVHKPEDLNHLLMMGLTDNVMLLQHGVIQPSAESNPVAVRDVLSIPNDALVLGCFGFALPHKGIDTIIEAIKPLAHACGRDVYLIALNSVLDERSEHVIQECKKRARQLGVEDHIRWITDYQPIEACQEKLSAADYIIYPYRQTEESASGAVTIGLSTLNPVLVSPLEIFSDLSDVTWKMGGHDAKDIVDAILSLCAQPDVVTGLTERQREWLRARDWDVLSSRLLTVMKSLCRERLLSSSTANEKTNWREACFLDKPKQLLVDVSELYYRDARTGIQRVVHNILKELLCSPPDGYIVYAVYGDKEKGFRYTDKFSLDGKSCHDEQEIVVGFGDVFLGLDLSAHLFPEIEKCLTAFKLAGVRICYVIYDIIPLRYPQFVVPGIGDAFGVWLRALVRHADELLCISNSVAQDIVAWCHEYMPDAPLPSINYFYLGADVGNSTATKGLPRDCEVSLKEVSDRVSFLMVGTMEPRKGYEQVLDAFELLWKSKTDINLVIVGKRGWNVDSLIRRLEAHRERNKHLFWFDSASDEFLEKLYSASTCLIAASYCEGFGLPLIESAQHGVPIFARNIPVFHEVAQGHAYYFDAATPDELADSLKDWVALYTKGEHPKSDGIHWLTWKESAGELSKLLFHVAIS